jgi:hypothetical protein
VPAAVREPTLHDHLTVPVLPAVLETSPAAVLEPLLYWTSIVQSAPASVFVVNEAVHPLETDAVRLTFVTVRG